MNDLFERLYASDEYIALKKAICGNAKTITVTGAAECSKAHILAALCSDAKKRVCVICQNEPLAAQMQKNLECFLDDEVARLIPGEISFGNTLTSSFDVRGGRIAAISRIISGKSAVMSVAALLCYVMKKDVFENIWHDSLVNWVKSFR